MKRRWFWVAAAALVFFALGPPAVGAEKEGPPAKKKAASERKDRPKKDKEAESKVVLKEPIVVKLEEVPAFGKDEVDGSTRYRFPRGTYVRCSTQPSKEVKAYPKLKSKQPLYGSITLGGSVDKPSEGKKYFFVLDESGTTDKPKTEKAEKKSAEKTPLRERLVEGGPRTVVTYDRLYFDLNGDRDLTNDKPLKPAKETPFDGIPTARASVGFFEDLCLPCDFGESKTMAVVPWLQSAGPQGGLVMFVPKTARKGVIRLGDEEFTVWLSQPAQQQVLSGRFDSPSAQLEVFPKGVAVTPLRAGPLALLRQIGGKYVSVSATPAGDQLTVQPFRGDLGVLEVNSGGRAITKLGVGGSFVSRNVLVTAPILDNEAAVMVTSDLPRQLKLPVGDYYATTMNVRYGELRFTCRKYDDPRTSGQTPPNYSLKVRKDKPCQLKFSARPSVQFLGPKEGVTGKPGGEVRVACMLAEPEQGIQITGLYTAPKAKPKADDEGPRPAARERRLDPTIVIRNSVGEEVAKGVMPFG